MSGVKLSGRRGVSEVVSVLMVFSIVLSGVSGVSLFLSNLLPGSVSPNLDLKISVGESGDDYTVNFTHIGGEVIPEAQMRIILSDGDFCFVNDGPRSTSSKKLFEPEENLYSDIPGQMCGENLTATLVHKPSGTILASAEISVPPARGWPMFMHDSANSGSTWEDGPLKGMLLWRYPNGTLTSPAVSNGKVYVGDGAKLVCLDSMTGMSLWSYTTSGNVGSPAVWKGRVYFASYKKFAKNFHCVNAETGALVWDYELGGYPTSSPTVVEGRVYVGADDAYLYCLDADSGSLRWRFKTGGTISGTPAFSEGKVFLCSLDKNVYCLNAADGTKIWNYVNVDALRSSPVIVGGRVYLADGSRIFCLDAEKGNVVWEKGGIYSDSSISPTVSDGKVYIATQVNSNSKIYCFCAENGEELWKSPLDRFGTSPVTVAANGVYVAGGYNTDGEVYCFNPDTGERVWKLMVGYVSSCMAVTSGRIYVSSKNGVYCIFDGQGDFDYFVVYNGDPVLLPPGADIQVWSASGTEHKHVLKFDNGDESPEGHFHAYFEKWDGIWASCVYLMAHTGDLDLSSAGWFKFWIKSHDSVSIKVGIGDRTPWNTVGSKSEVYLYKYWDVSRAKEWQEVIIPAWEFDSNILKKTFAPMILTSDPYVRLDFDNVVWVFPIKADFTFTQTGPNRVKMEDRSKSVAQIVSWKWDLFDDGSVDSTEQNPEFTGLEPGTFKVKLTVEDISGRKRSYVGNVTVTGGASLPDRLLYTDSGLGPNLDGALHYFDGGDGSRDSPPWTINVAEVSNQGSPGDSGRSWIVSYTNGPGYWGGFYCQFNSTQSYRDYTHLVFWVKGNPGDENFLIGMKGGGNEVKMPLSKYVSLTGEWQEVRIPLCDFSCTFGSVDFSSLSLPWIIGFTDLFTGKSVTVHFDNVRVIRDTSVPGG
ncbi:MAG: PQQ-binding-like beta-propeller repeat protein [Candidatus Hadarchaeales archaeon]